MTRCGKTFGCLSHFGHVFFGYAAIHSWNLIKPFYHFIKRLHTPADLIVQLSNLPIKKIEMS